jgi:hypothetical protein
MVALLQALCCSTAHRSPSIQSERVGSALLHNSNLDESWAKGVFCQLTLCALMPRPP